MKDLHRYCSYYSKCSNNAVVVALERKCMTKELIKTFQYRITQATASQLVVILYDLADRYLEDACESDEEVQIRDNIYMSGKVIDQLISGLDMQYEVSANLFLIYNHIKRTLISVSVNLNKAELKRVRGLLKNLRESFYEVSKQDTSEPLMKNTQTVYSGLTYSKGGISNETQTDNIENRGFRV